MVSGGAVGALWAVLNRRLGDIETVRREVAAGQEAQNTAKATVNWRCGVREARVRLARLYPS